MFKIKTQHNKIVKIQRDKPFSIYERLAIIFGADRANGKVTEAPIDMAVDVEKDDEDEDDSQLLVKPKSSSQQTESSRRKRYKPPDDVAISLEEVFMSIK